jgi:hypothetical protein
LTPTKIPQTRAIRVGIMSKSQFSCSPAGTGFTLMCLKYRELSTVVRRTKV